MANATRSCDADNYLYVRDIYIIISIHVSPFKDNGTGYVVDSFKTS